MSKSTYTWTAWAFRVAPFALFVAQIGTWGLVALFEYWRLHEPNVAVGHFRLPGPLRLVAKSSRCVLESCLAVYVVSLHLFACIGVMRMCWGTYQCTARARRSWNKRASLFEQSAHGQQCRSGTLRVNHRCHGFTDRTGATGPAIRHAIMIPSYKEDIDTLRGTLDVLAGHPMASLQYDVRCAFLLVRQDH